jgi:hypothetical protein
VADAVSGLSRLDPQRRDRLAMLGYELLALRGSGDTPASNAAAPGTSANPESVLRLVLLGIDPAQRSAPLLHSLLVALGLGAGEIGFEPDARAPVLALGAIEASDPVRGPTLTELRDPSAKRAFWPVLRGLRRRLHRDAGG